MYARDSAFLQLHLMFSVYEQWILLRQGNEKSVPWNESKGKGSLAIISILVLED